jgi:Holliday junction resolvasome RuvABC endonuclease subunit
LIRIGVDTGAHLAIVVLEFGQGKPRFVHKQEIEVGHSVKLSRPKVNKIGRVQTQQNLIDDVDLLHMRYAIKSLLDRFCPEGVAEFVIERVRVVVSRERFGASMATGISDAQWIGGEIAGMASALGHGVATVRADAARKAITGKGAAKDADITPIVIASIAGWPKQSGKHARDAAVYALFAARAAQVAEAGAARIRFTSSAAAGASGARQ